MGYEFFVSMYIQVTKKSLATNPYCGQEYRFVDLHFRSQHVTFYRGLFKSNAKHSLEMVLIL